MPINERASYWIAMTSTLAVSWLATFVVIVLWKDYGIATFILTPIALGSLPVLLHGRLVAVSLKRAFVLGLTATFLYCVGLILFAWEGLICIAMALPLAIPICLLAAWIGYLLVGYRKPQGTLPVLIAAIILTGTAFVERDLEPVRSRVTTSVVIEADRSTVWDHLIQFHRIPDPSEFIFRSGISYPIDARIEGHGVGAIRYCNFNTGAFVEPITSWNEPELLAFDVQEQPAPMTELGLKEIDAAHLHGCFVSEKGQFKLTRIADGRTLLEGTTWYHHRISPEFYWKPWSNMIIHLIHERVLGHIKTQAEGK